MRPPYRLPLLALGLTVGILLSALSDLIIEPLLRALLQSPVVAFFSSGGSREALSADGAFAYAFFACRLVETAIVVQLARTFKSDQLAWVWFLVAALPVVVFNCAGQWQHGLTGWGVLNAVGVTTAVPSASKVPAQEVRPPFPGPAYAFYFDLILDHTGFSPAAPPCITLSDEELKATFRLPDAGVGKINFNQAIMWSTADRLVLRRWADDGTPDPAGAAYTWYYIDRDPDRCKSQYLNAVVVSRTTESPMSLVQILERAPE